LGSLPQRRATGCTEIRVIATGCRFTKLWSSNLIGTSNEMIMDYLLLLLNSVILLSLILIPFLSKNWLIPYLNEKGKGLARKEDIEEITEKVESVKVDYSKLLEEVKTENQLRIEAVSREKTLKKEVYLTAFEAINKYQGVLGSFMNLEAPSAEFSKQINEYSSATAKIQIVGSESTVNAVTEFLAQIGTLLIDLLIERARLLERKSEIEILNESQRIISEDVQKLVSSIGKLNLQVAEDQNTLNSIQQHVVYKQRVQDETLKRIEGLSQIQQTDYASYLRKCIDEFFRITDLIPPIVFAIRKEIDLEIDENEYLRIFQESQAKGKQVFEKLRAEIIGS